jgi:hypothetical protein
MDPHHSRNYFLLLVVLGPPKAVCRWLSKTAKMTGIYLYLRLFMYVYNEPVFSSEADEKY